MRVVAENSEADIARDRAVRDLGWPLRELLANMLRVARGAGRPHEIGSQAAEVIQAYQAYRQVVGFYPDSSEVGTILRDAVEGPKIGLDDDNWAEVHAEEMMLRGAMQVLASRAVMQRTQETVGDREMNDGMRAVTEARRASSERWLKQYRAKAASAKSTAKTKAKTKSG